MADSNARELQKQILGSVIGIALVYILFNVGLPWFSAWFSNSSKQRAELQKLASRREEATRTREYEDLERELAELQAAAKKKKENKESAAAGTTASSARAPDFQFPRASKKPAETGGARAEPSSSRRHRSPARAPAAVEPTATSNPWASAGTAAPAPAPAPAPALAPAPTRPPAPANAAPAAAAGTAGFGSNPWASPAPAPVPAASSATSVEIAAQDAEYEEHLLIDQARQRSRAEAAQQVQQQQQQHQRRLEDLAARKESLRQKVHSEPPALAPALAGEERGEEVLRIQFRLRGFGPRDAVKFSRRFRTAETTDDVMRYWQAHGLVLPEEMENVTISTSSFDPKFEPGLPLSTFGKMIAMTVLLTKEE